MRTSNASTILVTGGAGYIGSHAALALLDAGQRVVVLDDLSTGSLLLLPAGAIFVRGCAGDAALVECLLREHGVKGVMHFAAAISVEESVARPDFYYRRNLQTTLTLATACARAGVGSFLLSSTAAVYGEGDGSPLSEEAPIRPINPYGRSKACAETVVADLGAAAGMATAVLRYFNVAGADPALRSGQASHEAHHLIEIASQVATGARDGITIFGQDYPTPDGTALRDYVHVADVASAHLLALQACAASAPRHRVYNVGYGRAFSVLEVLEALSAEAGRRLPARVGPRRAGDPAILLADSSRIRAELGWRPRHAELRQMVGDALRWELFRRERLPAGMAMA